MKKVELQEIKGYLEDQLNFVNWRLEHAPKYMNEEDEKEKGKIERYIDLIDNAYKKAPLGSKP